MNDDDLLSLPADGEPDRMSGYRPELPALSSEARLATALLMQAQALDGLHRAHADLLRRLEGAPDPAALQRAIDGLQQSVLAQLARERRRGRRRRLVGACLALLLLAAAAIVLVSERQRLDGMVADLRSAVQDGRGSRPAEIEQVVAGAVERAGAAQAAAIDDIGRKLQSGETAAQARIDQLGSERDGLSEQLAAAHAELQSLHDAKDKWQQDLATARDERNRQIGENAQLRDQVADRDRRLDELGHTLADLHAASASRAAAPAAAIVTSQGNSDSLPARITAALRSSGVSGAQVLEVGGVDGGALANVLLLRQAADGKPPLTLQAGSARIVAEHGRAWLRLEQVRTAGAESPAVAASAAPGDAPTNSPAAATATRQDIELPALDTAAWRALGLALPAGFTPLPQVKAALASLLPHGFLVAELGSFDGEHLGALVLREEDAEGRLLRTLHADEAVLKPVGPELELRDGTITTESDERPFFHGVYNLPLPGADYGGWLAAVGSAAP